MTRGDRGLELVRAGSAHRLGAAEDAQPLVDRRHVPERTILVGEQHELAVGAEAGVPPRVLEEQQREEAECLRLVGHENADELREADRLRAELAAHESLAGARGIALVEDEVQHPQNVRDALGQ